jgi:HYR domain-containing protein
VASLTCAPASGTTFPIGTTTVTCTATDTHGNTSSASFTVHVKGAAEQLADLLTDVTGIGPGTSLADKVKQAQSYVAADDASDACSPLTAFTNEVEAQTHKTIPPAQAATMIASANRISNVLGC